MFPIKITLFKNLQPYHKLIHLFMILLFSINFVSTTKYDPNLYNLYSPLPIGNIFGTIGSLIANFFCLPFGFLGVFFPILIFTPLKNKNFIVLIIYSLLILMFASALGGIISSYFEKDIYLLFGTVGNVAYIFSQKFFPIKDLIAFILCVQIYILLQKYQWNVYFTHGTIPRKEKQNYKKKYQKSPSLQHLSGKNITSIPGIDELRRIFSVKK